MNKMLVLLTLCLSMTALANSNSVRKNEERFNHLNAFEINHELGGYNCRTCNNAHIPADKVEEHIIFHEEFERMNRANRGNTN